MAKDLSSTVMKKIVSWERRRSVAWLGGFSAIVGGLLFVILGLLLAAIGDILDRGIGDQLSLLSENREIVEQYWQDTLATVALQLPQGKILAILAIAVLALFFFWFTRKRLGVVRRRLKQVLAYK